MGQQILPHSPLVHPRQKASTSFTLKMMSETLKQPQNRTRTKAEHRDFTLEKKKFQNGVR
jgi:hypothetical protein